VFLGLAVDSGRSEEECDRISGEPSNESDVISPFDGCAPQEIDPGRTDPVAGPSPNCAMIVARSCWLEIPEADYVGHMSSPAVGQRPVLGRLLGEVLKAVRPAAVLFLGGSTGNGLEYVNPDVTARVVVIDINPKYLLRLRERFPRSVYELDMRCGDVAEVDLEREADDLVHAGLILEYVAWPVLLPRIASSLRPGGVFSVILQMPSASSAAVTPTGFTRLRALAPLFRFVEPTALIDAARDHGLRLNARHTESLPSGKSFAVLRFEKSAV